MLTKELIDEVLKACLNNGADYSELYIEDSSHYVMQAIGSDINKVSKVEEYGVGIRVFANLTEVYGYTNDISRENLLNLASSLGKSIGKEKIEVPYELKKIEIKKHNVIKKREKIFH